MRRRPGQGRNARVVVVGAFLILGWFGLGYRLFQVQALEADVYASDGLDQRVRDEELPADRGTIYDRDGVELAVTVDAVTVIGNPSQIDDPEEVARVLSSVVGVDAEVLADRLDGDGQFVYIARGLDKGRGEQIAELVDQLGFAGISLTTEPKRSYPSGSLAAQLVGFVRADTQEGLEGIEAALDGELTGEPGRQIVERDQYGTPIPQAEVLIEPPVSGSDVVLTIDRSIQFAAERSLSAALERTNAVAGTVIVLDVDSGEVLAMANAPGFDPNDRGTLSPELFRNRAISDVYEPGSTLKVVTIAAALDQGLVAPSTKFEVPAELSVHDKTYTDVGRKETEVMSVAEIVARSSNIGTIMIQDYLGNTRHHEYLKRFGLGATTGTGLPVEASGNLHPVATWCETTCGPSTAIGYRVDVTPLQMAAVFAAIANDGVWVEPHVVREIVEPDGRVTTPDRVERPVMSERTADTMRRLLEGVVEVGTGQRAAVEGFAVGGKTGTTEKVIPGVGYSPTARISSFIGIAPIDHPEIVVAVVLDSPHGEIQVGDGPVEKLEFGGVSAAPVFSEVVEATLNQLGVVPHGG